MLFFTGDFVNFHNAIITCSIAAKSVIPKQNGEFDAHLLTLSTELDNVVTNNSKVKIRHALTTLFSRRSRVLITTNMAFISCLLEIEASYIPLTLMIISDHKLPATQLCLLLNDSPSIYHTRTWTVLPSVKRSSKKYLAHFQCADVILL